MGMKKQNMALMLGMMMAMSESSMHNHSTPNKKVLKKPKKKIIPKGLKEFFYGEKVIYALNKKNADRKAIKQGLIIPVVVVPKGTFCVCKAPLVRTGNNTNGYCGSCGKDLN